MAKKPTKHIGFAGAQKKVESEGYGKKAAGAIVAAASRKAKKSGSSNTRLKSVKG